MTTGKGERRTEGGQLRLAVHAGLVIPPGNKPPHSGDSGRAREGRQVGHAGCGADPGLATQAQARARRTCRSSAGLRGRALAPVRSAPLPQGLRRPPPAALNPPQRFHPLPAFQKHTSPHARLPPSYSICTCEFIYLFLSFICRNSAVSSDSSHVRCVLVLKLLCVATSTEKQIFSHVILILN